jgi:DNA-binding transcriptional regulator YhcF (GntR family)
MTDWTDGRPIFMDLADRIAADILAGLIPEETQVPSTNELAAHYRINPATAGKALNRLVDQGIVYKRRGLGMAPPAPRGFGAQRRDAFSSSSSGLVEEGRRLGLSIDEIVALVTKERDEHPTAGPATGTATAGTPTGIATGITTASAGITLRGLTKSYGTTEVLVDVSATLEPGRIYGLLGANGTGKTTLLACIAGHTFRDGGEIRIDGHDPLEHAPTLARLCFVHEDQAYNDAFSVADILAVMPTFYPEWDDETATRLMRRFRIPRRTRSRKPPAPAPAWRRPRLASGAYTFLTSPTSDGCDARHLQTNCWPCMPRAMSGRRPAPLRRARSSCPPISSTRRPS